VAPGSRLAMIQHTNVEPVVGGERRDAGGRRSAALVGLRVGDWLMMGPRDMLVREYPDGPTLVRGVRWIANPPGDGIACPRGTVAICRCGRSRSRPFCDGTHKHLKGQLTERSPGSRREERPSAQAPRRAAANAASR
jgi:CDGSH-type Zn-finger protein